VRGVENRTTADKKKDMADNTSLQWPCISDASASGELGARATWRCRLTLWSGVAWLGLECSGMASRAWRGVKQAWSETGVAWRGVAWRGVAWRGRANTSSHSTPPPLHPTPLNSTHRHGSLSPFMSLSMSLMFSASTVHHFVSEGGFCLIARST
jgi:hypothetical protein